MSNIGRKVRVLKSYASGSEFEEGHIGVVTEEEKHFIRLDNALAGWLWLPNESEHFTFLDQEKEDEQETKTEGGVKHDNEKCRMDLIPSEAEIAEAWVWTFGAAKYGDRNWQEGIKYSRIIAATGRHFAALKRGELIDPESKLPHAAHIRCNMGMLLWFESQVGSYITTDLDEISKFATVKSFPEHLNDLPQFSLTRPPWADTMMNIESQDESLNPKQES